MRSSVASAPSAPAAPESFDATHVTSSSVQSRSTVSGTSSYSSKAAHAGFPRGDKHFQVLLPEDLCNRSPGFSALVLREETPSPLLVGCPTDGLPELSREYCLVEAPGHDVVVLLAAEDGPTLLVSPFRLGIPHQASMLSPLPEVHAPGDPGLDLPGPADAQCLCQNGVGEDEGSLGFSTP